MSKEVGLESMEHGKTGSQGPGIGVGLLGYGFMGRAHSNAFKKLPYMIYPPPAMPRLVAIAGRNEGAVREAAARYGFETYTTDWRDLVADDRIQLFDNGGPNDIHAEACIAAARAGKHVLCEKPLARNAREAAAMLEAVATAGVKHAVAFNYRFVPAVLLARQWIQEGRLGEIHHFRAVYLQDWISDPSYPLVWRLRRESAGSGALGDIGAHIIDLARFLVGEIRRVAALTKTFIRERPLPDGDGTGAVTVDDAFATILEFEGGALGTLEASRLCVGRKNHLAFEINGSEGSLRFDLERLNEIDVYWEGDRPRDSRGFHTVLVTEADHPYGKYWWPPGHIIGWEHTFVHEIAHFLDAIANDRDYGPIGATFQDGYRNAVVCDAILQSADKETSVAIAY